MHYCSIMLINTCTFRTEQSESDTGDVLTLLSQRLEMYKEAVEHAESIGDSSKTRRFQRALKVRIISKSAIYILYFLH